MTPPVTTTARPRSRGAVTGAAFLMAVSAIGPGFLTQTTSFTVRLGAAMAFAILASILVDIGAQLNTWRVVCISGKRGHEVANAVVPGLGMVVTVIIVVGSFVFNIGNFNGCALGLQALFRDVYPLDFLAAVSVSALIAVGLFLLPAMLKGMDWFTKGLGAAMILMTLYVVLATQPPVEEAAYHAIVPEPLELEGYTAIATLIGGTIGGYIMFSGAHRLVDGGITGAENARRISWASVQGILIAGLMRVLVFLAILGVLSVLPPDHLKSMPPEQRLEGKHIVFNAFQVGAGDVGYYLSGLVFWAAAITSVVGCSYTSISFLHRSADQRTKGYWIAAFVVFSLVMTIVLNQQGLDATQVLIGAGTINGVLIPVVLAVVLIAAYRRNLMGAYRHPWWVGAFGLLAFVISLAVAGLTVYDNLPKILPAL